MKLLESLIKRTLINGKIISSYQKNLVHKIKATTLPINQTNINNNVYRTTNLQIQPICLMIFLELAHSINLRILLTKQPKLKISMQLMMIFSHLQSYCRSAGILSRTSPAWKILLKKNRNLNLSMAILISH